uniref:Serum response factor-binding protein 1 n=1 Tax=Cynoglossus semilaevis TaxID=244447 RepID=A0A3P8VYR3_CYNSE
MTGGLNLNNEVVKMRKDVKRVRALIIRKLTRQIGALKKKKGKEAEVEKNQRRAARLLEEIHAMKALSPDLVTKTALQKNLKFEEVCKNPKSNISDRAIARIATYPQFHKKIEDIKAAIKAFKEERMKGGKQGGKEKVQNKSDIAKKSLEKHVTDTETPAESADTADVEQVKIENKNVKQPSTNRKNVEKTVKNASTFSESKIQIGSEKQPVAVLIKVSVEEEEESGLESSDEEDKEYFDDSTEERFHKQSSQSEESDDDFFFGKVNKFKKKKKKDAETTDKQETGLKVESVEKEKIELESRPRSKSLQSVFCSSLSGPKQSAGGGAGRGSGGDTFRGQRKPYGRGQGRGRGTRPNAFSQQAPKQALHPSWEASKRRKEQQGQILAFQGKKIKFDDDD